MSHSGLMTFASTSTASRADQENALLDKLLSAEDQPAAAKAIAELLDVTQSYKVRDAAALALADIRWENAAAAINAVLTRPHIAPEAGTLVFALDELRSPIAFPGLLNVVERGSYEARATLLMLLKDVGVASSDPNETGSSKARLSQLALDHDPEVAELAGLVLELLETGPNASP